MNTKIGYISNFPNYKLTKSGTIKDFKGVSYFLYYGILQKRVSANDPVVFTYRENATSMDLFGNPRLDIVEILDVDIKQWLADNKSNITQEELEKIKAFKEGQYPIKKAKKDSLNNLEVFFEIGTQEEKQFLLHTLESTLIKIDSENKYYHAISLIAISNKYKLDSQFSYKIFIKANAHYRYKLWLESYVNFCDPNYLYKKISEEGDSEQLKERLHFSLFEQNGNIEVYFKGIKDQIIENISKAKKSLKIAMAWFTNYDIFEKLLELRGRNISIDLIIINDLINNGGYCLNFNELIENGGSVYLSEFPSMMHHKFCIIDDEILINGSYNWTYYAETINEENILIIKEKTIISSFVAEFERLLKSYPKIEEMPETVPDRPEYDRSSFKHYITRELQIRANNRSGDEKIRLLHQAIKIAPDFPGNIEIVTKYKDQFDIIDSQQTVDEVTSSVINKKQYSEVEKKEKTTEPIAMSQQLPPQELEKTESFKTVAQTTASLEVSKVQAVSASINTVRSLPINTPSPKYQSRNQPQTSGNFANITGYNSSVVNYEPLMCNNITLGIDNSSSMKDYYQSGLVKDIINKVISVSLKYTRRGIVEVWTYNNQANRIGEFSLSNISNLNSIQASGGTTVSNLINKIQMNLNGKSLVIVLTDGEDNTIKNVVANISNKANSEFWQFIGIGAKFSSFTAALNMDNASFCHFDNIRTMEEKDIIQAMLSDYLKWVKK